MDRSHSVGQTQGILPFDKYNLKKKTATPHRFVELAFSHHSVKPSHAALEGPLHTCGTYSLETDSSGDGIEECVRLREIGEPSSLDALKVHGLKQTHYTCRQ